jgi:hypothetical protein
MFTTLRNRWLALTILLQANAFVLLFAEGLAMNQLNAARFGSMFGACISFFLCYFFPYKKRGTKFLMYLLFATPVSVITSVALIFLYPDLYAYPIWHLIGFIPTSYWWVLSLRLRRENQAAKQFPTAQPQP